MSLGPGQGAELRAGWPHALGWGFRSWRSLCQSTLLPVPTAGCPPETRAKTVSHGNFPELSPTGALFTPQLGSYVPLWSSDVPAACHTTCT